MFTTCLHGRMLPLSSFHVLGPACVVSLRVWRDGDQILPAYRSFSLKEPHIPFSVQLKSHLLYLFIYLFIYLFVCMFNTGILMIKSLVTLFKNSFSCLVFHFY